MSFWPFGVSKRIGRKTWLNLSAHGNPSITRSLGGGLSINWSPRYGISLRFRRRLKRW
jgi:hypothetical protein